MLIESANGKEVLVPEDIEVFITVVYCPTLQYFSSSYSTAGQDPSVAATMADGGEAGATSDRSRGEPPSPPTFRMRTRSLCSNRDFHGDQNFHNDQDFHGDRDFHGDQDFRGDQDFHSDKTFFESAEGTDELASIANMDE